jgi:4-amino-4-deoxy-L-arabinose transferase-like glycosyltransferase
MNYVSLIIEFLRGRPVAVFWTVVLTQAAIWTVIPSLFYAAPPGDVPLLLAVGREFVLGSYLGPPLAFWLGEVAFRLLGIFGLYLLAQACIVTAYWAVFKLGSAIVGTRHAVLGILLMIGIAVFTVPSPGFGPAVLAAPLWALSLLYYWRAVGEGKRGSWFLLALFLGLLVLTNYAGVILIVLMTVFTFATQRGRQASRDPEPWLAVLLFVIVVFPHAAWLQTGYALVTSGFDDSLATAGRMLPGVWLCLALVLSHLGLVLLALLASGWPGHRRRWRDRAPEINRAPVEFVARSYIYFFAIAPALCAVAIVFVSNRLGPFDRVTPLVMLSGLAIIVATGDQVMLYRERLVSSAWAGLLLAPPAMVVLSLVVLPWTYAVDLKIAQPANAEARFFADSFQRRTGQPLRYVAGDIRLAPMIALAAPSRPHVYFDWAPQRSPWTSTTDIYKNGGLLVWPAADNAATPPANLKAQFPAMVTEVQRSFSRAVQGILPLIRVGWSVIRPQ